MSLGNPFILGSKGQRLRLRGTKQCWHGFFTLLCVLAYFTVIIIIIVVVVDGFPSVQNLVISSRAATYA